MNRNTLAYVIGVAIGDGNLSNPNKRAVRLRVTCDNKYPNIIRRVISSIQEILPNNKVSVVLRSSNCTDISCYSNNWENLLNWKAKGGSKFHQKVSIPDWIKQDKVCSKNCLKGLIETDGSVYADRKYTMVNFVTTIKKLSQDVLEMISSLGFSANIQSFTKPGMKTKYTIRVSRKATDFIRIINIDKN